MPRYSVADLDAVMGVGQTPAPDYDALIDEVAAAHGVDPAFVRAVVAAESNYNPAAVSPKGAQGLMQLMPATAKQYGVTDPFDPVQNLTGGTKHLAYLSGRYPDRPDLVAAAYNAGEGAVAQYGGIPPYPETQAYVKKVTGKANGNGTAKAPGITVADLDAVMGMPLPQPETYPRVDRDLPPSLENQADDALAARLAGRVQGGEKIVTPAPAPVVPPATSPVATAPMPTAEDVALASGGMTPQSIDAASAVPGMPYYSAQDRVEAWKKFGHILLQMAAEPFVRGGAAALGQPTPGATAFPEELPGWRPATTEAERTQRQFAAQQEAALALGMLGMRPSPGGVVGVVRADAARAAREANRVRPPETGWGEPEARDFLGRVDALQTLIQRGATPGERAAAEEGLKNLLRAYGIGIEDLPAESVRVNPEVFRERPPALTAAPSPPPPSAPPPGPRTGRGRTSPAVPEAPAPMPPAAPTGEPSTVPEKPATIVAQTEAVAAGKKPAVLVPPTMQTVETSQGTVVYDPQQVTQSPEEIKQAVESGQGGEILGYGVEAKPKPGEPAALVETRGPQGEEIQTVVSPVPVPPAVTQAAERMQPEGGTVTVTPPEQTEARAQEVIAERQAEAPQVTVADLDRVMGERPEPSVAAPTGAPTAPQVQSEAPTATPQPPPAPEPVPAPPLKPEPVEATSAPFSPPGKRWRGDPGAIPGEPGWFLDGETAEDAKAFIVEVEQKGGGVLFEPFTKDGKSLGQFDDMKAAAHAAEYVADRGTPTPAPVRQLRGRKGQEPAPVEPTAPAEEPIAIGDTISDGLVRGRVTGDGSMKYRGKDLPAWKVEILSGREKGKTSVIPKEGAVKVKETPEPPSPPSRPASAPTTAKPAAEPQLNDEIVFLTSAGAAVRGTIIGAPDGRTFHVKDERLDHTFTVKREDIREVNGSPFDLKAPSRMQAKETPKATEVPAQDASAIRAEIDRLKAENARLSAPKPRAMPGRGNVAERLRSIADGMQKQIDEKLNPAIGNQMVTARRARIAGNIRERGDRLADTQATLRALADAHEAGTIPESLKGITTKAALEALQQAGEKMPRPGIHKSLLKDLLEATKNIPGTKEDRALLSRAGMRDDTFTHFRTDDEIAAFDKLMAEAQKHGVKTGSWNTWGIDEYKRLKAIGITTEEQFTQAKKDLAEIRSTKKSAVPDQQRKIKELEAGLIGLKIPGYFPTPKPVIDEMLARADIQEGMKVLEPSAGRGDIADAVKEQTGITPDVVEIQSRLADILSAKGYEPTREDFLTSNPPLDKYDRIVMNPPFENGQDIDHVRHAYDLLAPGGKLVSIMGEGAFFRSDKKATEFRDWIEEVGGTSEKLPEGSFKNGQVTQRTGVASRIVEIEKKPHAPQSIDAIVTRGIRTKAEADAAAETLAASRQQFETATGAERASLARALTNLDRAIRTFDDTQVSDVAPYRSTENVSARETPLEKTRPGADIVEELQQEAVRHVTRDTATDTDRALARAVVADLATSGDAESVKPTRRLRGRTGTGTAPTGGNRPAERRSKAPRTLGLGIPDEIASLGRIDLRGRQVASIRDIADLAQVYRDPRLETFRIIYTKGDAIVAVEGVTSRLPGTTTAITSETPIRSISRMRDRMNRLGADGYYLLHNHPGGASEPSSKDIDISRMYSNSTGDSPKTPRGVPGFRGHVIINSGEYSVIAPDTYAVTTISIPMSGPDALHVPSTPHPVVGMPADNPRNVAEAGKLIQQRDGWVTLLYLSGGKATVRAIEEVPESWISDDKHMRQYLTGRTRAYGAPDVVAFSPKPGNALYAGLYDLVRRAILTDAVVLPKDVGIGMPNRGSATALVHPRIARVESPRAYQDEEWFKQVRAEAEERPAPSEESIGPGAQATGESRPAEPFVTSTKHAVKDREREARGLERIEKPETFTNQAAWDEAKRQIEEDPDLQDRLINELVLQPRALSPVENALLLHQSVGLINERNDLAKQLENAKKNGFEDRADQITIQVERVEAEMTDLENVIHAVGTESGRSLQARKMLADQDYSLVSMESRKRIAKGGVPLTEAERDEIKRLHDEIAKLQAALVAQATTAQSAASERQATQAVKDLKDKVAKEKAKTPAEKPRDLEAERKVILAGLGEVSDDTPIEDLRPWIQKLAESFVEEGIVERDPLIDAVHKVLTDNGLELTRRQTMDAISGFGDFRPLNPDPIKTKLRDLKGQMQQVAKLENIASKQPIPKTGVERRTPSDEERRLIQAVEEAKRRFGVVVTDPESQLKSALDALKTRLTHEIADLEWQIANKTKITKTKSPTPTDPEVEILRAQREALKDRFDALFGKTERTPEQRTQLAIQAVERSIADLEARIKAKDIAPRRLISRTPVTPELLALRARQTALREQLQELRDIDVRYQEQRKLRALEQSIAEYERRVAEGDLAPKPTAAGPDTPAIKAATVRRDAARAALEALRESTGYYDAGRIQRALTALEEANAELARKIKTHDLAPQAKGSKTPETDEIRRARIEHDFLAGVLREMRAAETPKKTPEEIALQTLKTRMAHKAADLEHRLEAHDFTPTPHREVRLDAEGQRLRIELDRLTQQFKEGLVKDRLARRTGAQKTLAVIGEVFNIPRLLMTSFDLSAVLRQGGFIAFGHPVLAAEAFPAMFRALRSAANQRAVMDEILTRTNAPLYHRAKLYFSDQDTSLSRMEEAYMSRWAEKIPGIGASQRAYVSFLNRLRADTFDLLARTLRKGSELTLEEAKAIANYINVATGRGKIGAHEAGAVGLNSVFFSPRYLASRFQLLAGQPLYHGSARTRKQVAGEYGKFLLGLAAVYALAMAADAKVETDPRSSDFGKIRFGKTRVDPLGGILQVTTLLSRVITGQTKTLKGNIRSLRGRKTRFGQDDTADVVARFLRTKLSPNVGAAIDILTGRNVVGEPVTPASAAGRALTPLAMQDVYESLREQGAPRGTALGILSIFGMGLQTYDTSPKGKSRTSGVVPTLDEAKFTIRRLLRGRQPEARP